MTATFTAVRAHRERPGRVAVFVGPTARADLVQTWLAEGGRGVDVHPPARMGDLWRVASTGHPAAIVLLDGLYESVPAVWHKEILATLDLDIPVYGAASLGALRAAELHSFGMIGVGAVFNMFARGDLVADDEVAVLHAPAPGGWRPLSVPLVNIRATVVAAMRERVLDAAQARPVIDQARRLFYPDRTWAAVSTAGPPQLQAWLADGNAVDIKASDAERACRTIVHDLEKAAPVRDGQPAPARLVVTPWWERLAENVASQAHSSFPFRS